MTAVIAVSGCRFRGLPQFGPSATSLSTLKFLTLKPSIFAMLQSLCGIWPRLTGRGRSAFPTFTRVVYHVGCLQHRFALRQPDDKYVIDASLYFNTSSLLGQGVYFISLCRFDLGIEDSTREIVSLR